MKAESIKIAGIRSVFFSPVLGRLMANRRHIALVIALTAMPPTLATTGLTVWPCPLKSTLGIACPGCGLTRAIVMLAQGHWQESIHLHAFAPIVVGGGILLAAGGVLPQKLRSRMAASLAAFERRSAITALLIVSALIYWVLRTIALI